MAGTSGFGTAVKESVVTHEDMRGARIAAGPGRLPLEMPEAFHRVRSEFVARLPGPVDGEQRGELAWQVVVSYSAGAMRLNRG